MGAASDELELEVQYDGAGRRRIEKRRIDDTGLTETVVLHYEGANVVAETQRDGAQVVSETTHLPGIDNPVLYAVGATVNNGSNTYALGTNVRGDVVAAVQLSTGTLVEEARLTEHGERTIKHINQSLCEEGKEAGSTSSVDSPCRNFGVVLRQFGIGGARAHARTKLVDLRNRVYATHLKGFLARDPLGPVDSYGLWNYVAGDPVNFRDPWGLSQTATDNASVAAEEPCSTSGGCTGIGDWLSSFFGGGNSSAAAAGAVLVRKTEAPSSAPPTHLRLVHSASEVAPPVAVGTTTTGLGLFAGAGLLIGGGAIAYGAYALATAGPPEPNLANIPKHTMMAYMTYRTRGGNRSFLDWYSAFGADITFENETADRAAGAFDEKNGDGVSLAEEMGILREASQGIGNFGLGAASRGDADRLGEEWTGEGRRLSSDGKAFVSRDGLRVYRPPTPKPNSPLAPTGVQANLERRSPDNGSVIGNGHLDITD